nr:MAG TPA: hypothetical protein [Caudoviricetes sp.]
MRQKVGFRKNKVFGKNTSCHLWRREDFFQNRNGLTLFFR